ncbi:MAG: hypothetical protein ACE5IL_06645 [Myxococcota bacterium]
MSALPRVPALAGLALCLCALAPLRGGAEERLRIDVRGGVARAVPVAVQRFAITGKVSAEQRDRFDRALRAGLEFSGLVDLVDREAFLDPVDSPRPLAQVIPCDNWRGIGADVLVQGSLEGDARRVRAHFRIWDVVRCQMQGAGGHFETAGGAEALLGRRLADEIVGRFTGTRGVAATQIAFISTRSRNKEVYLMEADGSDPRPVTRNRSINLLPDWSPDGDSLLYTSYRRGHPEVWRISRGRRPNGPLRDDGSTQIRGVWGPDGAGVALVVSHGPATGLYRVRPDGSRLEAITRGRFLDTSPTWSPDGSKIAFVSDRSGGPQLYLLDVDDRSVRRLTFEGRYNASPAWSPTGEWIAYQTQTQAGFDLYLIDPETGTTVPLVVHAGSDEDPSWAPDGRKIAFASARLGRYDVYTIDVDGRNLRRATRNLGECTAPAWSPWLAGGPETRSGRGEAGSARRYAARSPRAAESTDGSPGADLRADRPASEKR